MAKDHRGITGGKNPCIEQFHKFFLSNFNACLLQCVNRIPFCRICRLYPAECRVNQRIISAAIETKELLFHLCRRIINGEARGVLLVPFLCACVILQCLRAVLNQPCSLLFGFTVMEDLNMMLHGYHGKVVIKIIHGLFHNFLFHSIDGKRSKLSGGCHIRGIRHISCQLRCPLPAIREQQDLSPFIR